jgi:hypothetical protein
LYLNKGKKQHTTEEANKSRLITKVRWVVERELMGVSSSGDF